MPKRPSKIVRELDSLAEFIVDSAVGKPHKGDLLPDGRDPVAAALAVERKGARKPRASQAAKKTRLGSAKKSAAPKRKK
jgi:hypothetical protein